MSQTFTVNLPDIGEGVVEGEVIEWLKEVGAPLQQDEPVVIVMTDKATVELPAPYPGTLAKQYFSVGEIAIKDRPLYDIAVAAGISIDMEEAPPSEPPPMAKPLATASSTPRGCAFTASAGKALAAPPVRRMARDMGIDLTTIQGSGPGGRILAHDLRQASIPSPSNRPAGTPQRARPPVTTSTPCHTLPGDERIPIQGVRNYIAEKMVEAKYLIPHFSFFDEADASALVRLRAKGKIEAAKHGIRLTYTPYFIRALSLCLHDHPMFNTSVDLNSNEIVVHKQHNIGIAVKTERGVIVPVLKNVQEMGLHDIVRAFEELKTKAMTNKLINTDMQEATITLTNFGTEGGLWATPIINYPEVAILGLGRIYEKPVVRKGEICIRHYLNSSWCCDHRIIDGDMAAKFSHDFNTLILNPARLL